MAAAVSKQEETANGNGPLAVPSLTGGPPQQEGYSEGNPFALAQSIPGVYMTEDHRYWVNSKGPYPSVTTILDVMHKQALVEWWKNQIALSAMLHLPELIGLTAEEGIAKLRSYPTTARDNAGTLGSSIHLLAHMEGLGLQASPGDPKGFEVPNEAYPYLEAFRGFLGFLEAQGGKIVSSEHAVYSETEGYCGTYDLIVSLWDELWLLDLKSGRGYYPDHGLQLSAYANAEYIVLPHDPTLYPMPQVQHTAVLHVRPDQYQSDPPSGRWRLVEYPTTDRDYLAFLAALELYRWKQEGRFTKSSLNKATIHKGLETQGT